MIKFEKKNRIVSVIIIAVFVMITVLPFLILLQQSFKPRIVMFTDPPTFAFTPTMDHYKYVFQNQELFTYMKNSLIIALCSTVLCLLLGSLIAYSIAVLKVRGARKITIMIMITRMVPAGALMVPIYIIMRSVGLTGKYISMIFTYAALNLSFTVWMMRSFFAEIPVEIEQAAMMDGCSRLRSFFSIALPLTIPGLVATGILDMLNAWNEFMFALVLSNLQTRTVPIAISTFIGSISIDWGSSSAAAIIACIPVFLAGFFTQKYLTKGLTMGSVKG